MAHTIHDVPVDSAANARVPFHVYSGGATVFNVSEASAAAAQVPFHVFSGGGSVFLGSQNAQGSIINNFRAPTKPSILAWLSKSPYHIHHRSMCEDLLEDSGEWLFRKLEYTQWEGSRNSTLLWLHGIPGSGKSKLVAALINRLRARLQDQWPPVQLAYFYISKTGGLERNDPCHVLRAILKQASVNPEDGSIEGSLAARWEEGQEEAESFGLEAPTKPDFKESLALLLQILDLKPLVLVIDALDECNPATRHQLLYGLRNLVASSRNTLKIFVSSRNDSDITSQLSDFPGISITAHDNQPDIVRFIERELDSAILGKRLLSGRVPPMVRRYIVHVLTTKARAMFKWVELQIEELCNHQRIKHLGDIREELERVPRDLVDFYQLTYQQILQSGTTTRLIALRMFQWILHAQRPLTQKELCAAVSLGPDGRFTDITPDQILEIGFNFIDLDENLKTVHFSHASVLEYFNSVQEISQANAHLLIATRCLDTVSERARDLALGWYQVHRHHSDIYSYASRHWIKHLDILTRLSPSQTILSEVRRLLSDLDQGTTHGAKMESVKTNLSPGPSYEQLPRGTGLESRQLAVRMRSHQVFPHAPGTKRVVMDCSGTRTAIAYFDSSGLNHVDAGLGPRKADRTLLSLAAGSGNITLIFTEVSGHPVHANQCDELGRTPLSYAAEAGNDRIVNFLVNSFRFQIDPNIEDKDGHSPMWWALSKGRETAAWILLDAEGLSPKNRRLFWNHAPEWGVRGRIVSRLIPSFYPYHAKGSTRLYMPSPTMRRVTTPIRMS